jgi:hypothetical protein
MNKTLIKYFIILCIGSSLNFFHTLFSQEVPHTISSFGIYEFIDELANARLIKVNSAVKPYTRLFIAGRLLEAEEKRDSLNLRQRKELDFYLMDFCKEINDNKVRKRRRDLFYYKDDMFSLTVNPILGGEIFSGQGETVTYWKNGAEARGYVKNWGFYASLRDNHEKPLLGLPGYLTQREGGHIKDGTDWSEMLGGVTYSWKWGGAALVKDRIQWGNAYNGSNIFGGNNPTFIQFRLHINPVKWFDFNYFHGWLNSMVVDSARSYWYNTSIGSKYRSVYHKKFIAANVFTFTPLHYLNISAGNSIVYCDLGFHPAYLVPLFFYKSVDHSLNSSIDNMNSQMFFDISSRQINNLHLYASLFIDELSVDRFFKKDEWNYLSYKAGLRLSNYPLENISVTSEFTYTYPFSFQHYIPTLTFESNSYNLGHYLKDNSRELYFGLNYKPLRTLDLSIYFIDAVRGPDYTELGAKRLGNPPLTIVEWHNTTFGIKGSYQIINDLFIWLSFSNNHNRGEQSWSPEFFHGRKNILNLGFSAGF